VLDAQRSLYAAQLALAQSTQAIGVDIVAVYKALGGGWEIELPPPAPTVTEKGVGRKQMTGKLPVLQKGGVIHVASCHRRVGPHHTPGFIDKIKKREDVKVKCVWDPDGERAQKSATALGVPAVPDVKAIWADPEINAAIICSETNRHKPLVLACAKAKKTYVLSRSRWAGRSGFERHGRGG